MYCDHDHGRVGGARLVFWAVLVCVVLAFGMAASADEKQPPTIEPFLVASHTSDVLTGRPFLANPMGCEPTTDFLGVGATIAWKRVELDLAHGIKARDTWCDRRTPTRGGFESGTMVTVRWYAWRGRRGGAK